MTTTRSIFSKVLAAAEYAVGLVLGSAVTAAGLHLTGTWPL